MFCVLESIEQLDEEGGLCGYREILQERLRPLYVLL